MGQVWLSHIDMVESINGLYNSMNKPKGEIYNWLIQLNVQTKREDLLMDYTSTNFLFS